MGCDKAALVHPDGRPLARRCLDLLAQAGCDALALSIRHDQELPPNTGDIVDLAVIRDPAEGGVGPLSGIHAAMGSAPQADWLVLACDLPRLDLATLVHLIDARKGYDGLLSYRSEFDGLPEPLCAIYPAGAAELIARAMAADMRCPRKILIRENCRLLDLPTPRALENANTPDDWNLALQP
jgi:molybdopterin-guanine dinucleotide biosynthesis protein A